MGRRRRSMKLPNGYGSIAKLSGKRRNPYCVRPPVTEFDENGNPIRPKPICYTDTWINGFAALTAWKAGTYVPGMETTFSVRPEGYKNENDLVKKIIADYSRITRRVEGQTFAEVYKECYEYRDARKPLSENSMYSRQAAYKHTKPLWDIPLAEIRHDDFQKILDNCDRKMQTKSNIALIFRNVSEYAKMKDIIKTNYAENLVVTKTEVKSGTPFSEEEIKLLKERAKTDEMARKILVMIYSGFRVSAYKIMEINFEEKYIKSGVKNESSRNRIVPIHDGIMPFVQEFGINMIPHRVSTFREEFEAYCTSLGMDHHPHDTRHTFSALCEKYKVDVRDQKRMMGHRIGDITSDVYGHRTVEELRKELMKIPF